MFISDPLLILLTIVLCLILINIFYSRNGNVVNNFPPGPKPLPIIGNLHTLNPKKLYQSLIEVSKQYGSIFTVHIGTQRMVILCGYETVKDALINHAEEFTDRPFVPIFHILNKGYGMVFSNGENWKAMRRFTLSTLRDFGMGRKLIENKINEESDYLVEKIKSFKGKPFENTMIINGAVANIIVSILLGHRFEYHNPTFLRLMKLVNENVTLVGSPMVMLYNSFPSIMSWLPGAHKAVNQNAIEFLNYIKETFIGQRNDLDVNYQKDLIEAFLIKQQAEKDNNGSYFHNENLTMLVGNLFGAGTETTSTTLRWGILLMMKYPEIQKNVQNEIEKVIGLSQPQAEHRKMMPYTDAVIHETQRFGNILPLNLPRATTQDVNLRGYFLPKGTYVVPLLASVLRDKAHFERPDEFYPQHFLDSEGNFVKNEAFLPFSAGKRSCAGENLAKMELFLFFTRLLQNFTFQPPPGAVLDLTPVAGFTLSPMRLKICAVPRT